jgi:hypothetical protein
LVHDVYFALHDASREACERLVAACVEYLSAAEGVRTFAAGPRVAEHVREVNDETFDVALHIVFESKAHHDAYQSAALHRRFIEEQAANWKAVRVHDSYVGALREPAASP